LWPLEEAIKERVCLNGVAIPENAWKQPPDHIEEHHGWKFPPSEDVIADGYLGVYIRLHPRIHAPVAPTDEE
jgi:hypothetical protein